MTELTLTVEETAEILGISRDLAYKAVNKDDIPNIRIGRRIIIPREKLSSWLKDKSDKTDKII